MRLDRFLSEMGVGTRSELKKMIRSGRVSAKGDVVKDPGFTVDENTFVTVDGKKIAYHSKEYYLLNKPAGVICATEDPNTATVLDLFKENIRKDLFPVGRLDKDTVGLLLITNDGELAHRLLSPKAHVDKKYIARVTGEVSEETIKKFAEGLYIDETFTALPANLEILNIKDDITETLVTIREGKFHQIKRMFAACGCEIIYLKRISMGPLNLDETLPEGSFRPLTKEELSLLGLSN